MFQNCLFMLGSCDLGILAGGELGVWRGHLVRGRASRGIRGIFTSVGKFFIFVVGLGTGLSFYGV